MRGALDPWAKPRDRLTALIPFYAGLRIDEAVALNTTDVQFSAGRAGERTRG